ncbi:hypothetical protein SIL77_06730 [Exiguobacterium profundum]|uniref:hypothetical protein n=1 Tax=Exiguobacterium profundum TaxID=307643 RepID=UPI0029C3F432|nr:hypothetical protein [Exiguobacterium profundum]MDX5980959.1 hypothetical protein [Exiguobacterium profundum]
MLTNNMFELVLPAPTLPVGVGAPSGEQRKRSSSGGRLSSSKTTTAEEKARYLLQIDVSGGREGKRRARPSIIRLGPPFNIRSVRQTVKDGSCRLVDHQIRPCVFFSHHYMG